MKLTLYERFTRFSVPRTLFFCIMGVVLLVVPSFALNGAFYAIVGYLIVAGIFGFVDCLRRKKSWFGYVSLTISAILVLFGVGSILFARYLVHVAPLYLGALFLIEGVLYFIIAPVTPRGLKRTLLIVLSIMVFVGGAAVIVFTLGFGVDGVSGLGRVAGISSILAGVYSLIAKRVEREALK